MAITIIVHESNSVLIAGTVETSTPALTAYVASALPSILASVDILTTWSLLIALQTISLVSGNVWEHLRLFALPGMSDSYGIFHPRQPSCSPLCHREKLILRFYDILNDSNIIPAEQQYEAEAGTAWRPPMPSA